MTLPRAVAYVAPTDRALALRPVKQSLLPRPTQWCRCFFCKYPSSVPLPLTTDQSNWIECEYCGLDNEIPASEAATRLIEGRVPTRFF
jgi:hypothetical protein